LDILREKTPDINELHNDGGYGSKENDEKCSEFEITQIQTAIRGNASVVDITIEKNEADQYQVSCLCQKVVATKGRKLYKAVFNETICARCPLNHQCNFVKVRTDERRRYYFSEKEYYRKKRAHNILNIPPERRTLRANIEATVSEYRRTMPDGKVKVRDDLRLCSLRSQLG